MSKTTTAGLDVELQGSEALALLGMLAQSGAPAWEESAEERDLTEGAELLVAAIEDALGATRLRVRVQPAAYRTAVTAAKAFTAPLADMNVARTGATARLVRSALRAMAAALGPLDVLQESSVPSPQSPGSGSPAEPSA